MSGHASGTSTSIESQSAPDDSQLLYQAGQLAGNLRDRFREVERREQQLNDRLLGLDQEQRRVRLLSQEFADDSVSQDVELKKREQEFAEQLANGQRLLNDLQSREEQLADLRQDVEHERAGLREEMDRALEMERSTLQHSQSLVEAERRELAKQVERRHDEHQEALRQTRRELDTERRRLRTQLAGDIDSERSALQREREQWQHQKELEQFELTKHVEAQKLASDRFEQELAEQTERSRAELARTQEQVETDLLERCSQLEKERETWSEQSAAERTELESLRAELETVQNEISEANGNQQQQYRAVFDRLQEEHQRNLEAQQSEFERELNRRRESFTTEQLNHQRRLNEESLQQQQRLAEQRRDFETQVETQRTQTAESRRETEQEFEAEKEQWAEERAAQQSEIEQQLLYFERSAIEHETALAERQKQQDDEMGIARAEVMEQLRTSWDQERAELRSQLANDIDTERARLAEELEAFETRQQRETTSLMRQKEAQETALNQARSELVREKQQLNESLEEKRITQQSHLQAARCQFEEHLKRRVDDFEQRIEIEDKRIADSKAAHRLSVTESSESLAHERSVLEQDKRDWQADRSVLLSDLEQKERDIQAEQHIFYVQRQQWQQRVQSTSASQNLRQRQLQRFREVLTERERSLVREQALFEKARIQAMGELKSDREQLELMRKQIQEEHVEFHAEREAHQGEMKQERNRLKQRNERLDEMRKELEEASLRNLESRLAAEEVMADLIEAAGEDVAKARVAVVRTVIAGQIRDLQASTNAEHKTAQLVAVAQRELEDEAGRLKSEQEAFSELVSVRERNLKAEEQRLQTLSHNWERREHQWRTMRDDWLKEKLNAEQIIRSLLDEISDGIESPVSA
jgi:hypothetical protein